MHTAMNGGWSKIFLPVSCSPDDDHGDDGDGDCLFRSDVIDFFFIDCYASHTSV